MSSSLKLKSNAGGSVSLVVDDTLTTDIEQSLPIEASGGGMPIGAIIMYNGAVADIPAEWQLCDGTNGTPNMTDSFVMGTATEGDIGNTGGSNDAVAISHNHSFTGNSMGTHRHTGASHSHTISHTHTRGTMNISGNQYLRTAGNTPDSIATEVSGCFTNSYGTGTPNSTSRAVLGWNGSATSTLRSLLTFNASSNWSGNTSSPSSSSSGSTTPGSGGYTSAGTPSGTISSSGSAGTGLNAPKYVNLAYIQRMS